MDNSNVSKQMSLVLFEVKLFTYNKWSLHTGSFGNATTTALFNSDMECKRAYIRAKNMILKNIIDYAIIIDDKGNIINYVYQGVCNA